MKPHIHPLIKTFLFGGSAILLTLLVSSLLLETWFGKHVVLDIGLTTIIVLLLSFGVSYWDRTAEDFRTVWLKMDARSLHHLIVGGSLGTGLVIVSAMLSWSLGRVRFDLDSCLNWSNLIPQAILLLLVSVFEELISRGYMLFCLNKAYSAKVAIIITSVIFTLMHGLNLNMGGWFGISAFVNLFVAGWLMADLTIRTKGLGLAIGFHWAWDFFQGPILGFGVSGSSIGKSLLIPTIPSGHPLLTGGAFGLEAAIPTTICLILAVIGIRRLIEKHECS